ncbi:SRPBCC family protein [Actinomycetota bacterium]
MVLVVATYEAILSIPQPVDKTFSFVSDFCNAVHWDPRTYAVERTTDGPIGVGTRFMLTGGLMREELVRRLHIPQRIAGMALPYDVVKFDPPNEFVLKGESRIFRYCDDLEFFPESSGTRLRYFAELEMKGPLAIGEPLLRRMFKLIGDDATRNLPATVDHSV